MSKNYSFAKDFKEHKVEIDGVDVSAIIVEFEIYQDVFNPYWTASMVIRDAQNQLSRDGLTQGSRVNIKLEGRDGGTTFKFIINDIVDKELEKQQVYIYNVAMIDEGFFKDQKIRISKHYEDKEAKLIASEALEKLGGTGHISQTPSSKYTVIVPNMSPMTTAQWVAKWSNSKVNPGSLSISDYYGFESGDLQYGSTAADIIVYQQDHGKWSFKSIEEMIKDRTSVIENLISKPANLKDGENQLSEKEEYQSSMEQYKFISSMNAIPATVNGSFGSTCLHHNIKTKNAGTTTYNYSQDTSQDKSKKPFKGFDGLSNSSISYTAFNNENSMNDGFNRWKGSRKCNIMKTEFNRLLVSITGRMDMYNQLGKMVVVDLPSQQDYDPEILFDEYLRFSYIIFAMRHVFTQKTYTTFIELGKKRLDKAI